ncbi:hypothetical protein [Thioalkalivibrio sp. AKL10]|uniref:hypothetical protein n=1 Tax=Thioalkalivibrio sp. AKL10 TaxID=1158158 RepID=UPI0009D9530D|nr:hypothetical protein [Thioalkalivibrio sp. AKL10]
MFTLDAWLENPDPSLRIIDDHSRRVVAEWRGQELRDLLDSGIIAPTDCCGPHSRDTVHETIRNLILEACLEGITVQRRAPQPRPDAQAPPMANRSRVNAANPEKRHCRPHSGRPADPQRNRQRRVTCAQGPAGAPRPTKKTRNAAKGHVLHLVFRKHPPLH